MIKIYRSDLIFSKLDHYISPTEGNNNKVLKTFLRQKEKNVKDKN